MRSSVFTMTESEMSWNLSPMVNGATASEVKKLLDVLVKESQVFVRFLFETFTTQGLYFVITRFS